MLKSSHKAAALQDSIGKALAFIPLSPNQWTLLSLLAALIASYLIVNGQTNYAAAVFAVAVAFDAIDGAVARATKRATRFGAFLDGVVDRLAEGAILMALLFADLPHESMRPAIVLMLFFGTCMTSFVRAYAHHRGVIDESGVIKAGGFFERAERTILIFLMLVSASLAPQWFGYLAWLGAILSVFTFLQRFFYIYAGRKNG